MRAAVTAVRSHSPFFNASCHLPLSPSPSPSFARLSVSSLRQAVLPFRMAAAQLSVAAQPRSLQAPQSTYDVIVSGAGPVGLLLACELALARCSVLVLEKAADATSPFKQLPFGLRGLNSLSIESLYRRGLLDELELYKRFAKPPSNSAPAATQRPKAQAGVFFGGVASDIPVDSLHWKHRLPSSTDTSRFTAMAEIESILSRRARTLGVAVQHAAAITAFQATPDGVTVQAEDGQSFEAAWLVGCDGSRGVVRKAGGFEFAGTDPEFTGYSMTVDLADPEKLRPGRQLTSTGLYWQLQPGYVIMQDFDGGVAHKPGQHPTREQVQDVLRRVSNTDVSVNALHLANTWTDRSRQTTAYRKGRVLLAGDAAHIHSPLGGQGLNLGLGDAMNLGWKLAATIQNRAPAGLLDTYYTERHPIGARVLDWSRAQIATMKPNPHARALSAIIHDLLNTRDGATYFAGRVTGVVTRYEQPPAGGGGEGHWLAGYSMPNFELQDGTMVGELLHAGCGLLLDFDGAENGALLQGLVSEWGGGQMRYVSGRAKDQLGLSAVLVRPDGIVAWATDGEPDEQSLRKAISLWFAQQPRVEISQSGTEMQQTL